MAGSIRATISRTQPAGFDDISYPPGTGVGFGGAGSVTTLLAESGGSGMIVITTRYCNCKLNNQTSYLNFNYDF